MSYPWCMARPGDVPRLRAARPRLLRCAPGGHTMINYAVSVIRGGYAKRPGVWTLTGPAGALTMTFANYKQADRTNAGIPARTYTDRLQMTHRGEGLATAGRVTPAHNVPAPRDVDRWPTSRNGVGSHARVDPYREVRAYTAGPTRHPQRVRVRRAPTTRDSRVAAGVHPARHHRCRSGWSAVRGRAADVSRPDAPVMRRVVALRTCVLASGETSPSLLEQRIAIHDFDLAGVGAPCPNAPASRRKRTCTTTHP